MNYKQFLKIRIIIASTIGAIVAIAVTVNNIYLALSGVIIGMLFMILAKKSLKQIINDERTNLISGYAGRLTYSISTALLGLTSLILILISHGPNDYMLEFLGTILSYVVLFNIAIYSMSYKYYNKKYGAQD